MKVQDIYTLALLKFYYKYEKESLPNYFNGMFEPVFVSHDHYTRQCNNPVKNVCNTKLAEKSLRFSLLTAIENIDDKVIQKVATHSLWGYSNYAKLHLISLYDPKCNLRNCYICNNQQQN